MSEPIVLSLDGSTGVCGAALLTLRASGTGEVGGRFVALARRAQPDGKSQAKLLLRLVDDMLSGMGGAPEDLRAIVVGIGPGTFTGVRITVATARALGLALSIPVLGISTLGALAARAAEDQRGCGETGADLLIPVVDARRGQVFYGAYGAIRPCDPAGAGRWARRREIGVCDREALIPMVAKANPGNGRALVVGEDACLVEDPSAGVVFRTAVVEAERLIVGQELLVEPGWRPEGERLGPWLTEALSAKRPFVMPRSNGDTGGASGEAAVVGTPESVVPIYVRSPDADVHITKMKDPWTSGSGRR